MRSRLMIEILILISLIGLVAEIAGDRTWLFIGTLLVALTWALYRTIQD